MKKKFLILIITAFISAPAFAELTVGDTVNPEYLRNRGYSSEMARMIQKSTAEANGEAMDYPVEREEYNQPVIKFVRRVFMYLDPALDDHSFKNNHDIKTTPNIDDL